MLSDRQKAHLPHRRYEGSRRFTDDVVLAQPDEECSRIDDLLDQEEGRQPMKRRTSGPFAWCFDHGRLHTFGKSGTECSAAWVPLEGATEEEALRHKELVWGHAQFFDQLDLDRQGGLISVVQSRRDKKITSVS